MRYEVDVEMKMFSELVCDFSEKELVEGREERDHYPYAPACDELLLKAREVGLFSVAEGAESEAGGDLSTLCLMLEEICRRDAGFGGVIFADSFAREMAASASGSHATLEPGSDGVKGFLAASQCYRDPGEAPALKARESEAGTYVLDGPADFVVLAPIAGRALLQAYIEDDESCSLFAVDLSSKGVEVSAPVLTLGLHSCPVADLALDGAPGALIGERGGGARYFESAAETMNVPVAAMALGIMKASFDEALEYSKQRWQGGRAIIGWSEVQRILAGMAVKSRAADMLVSESCRAAVAKEPGWAMGGRAASVLVTRMACDVTNEGIQVLGGNGYIEEYGQEKRFRDAEQIQSLLGIAAMKELDILARIVSGEALF